MDKTLELSQGRQSGGMLDVGIGLGRNKKRVSLREDLVTGQ